ncbi:hypothetical protein B0H14DRAFT_161084 [Mycena olivaceomarginata]|nr:hypothetical protein B0H14DRAFT_161084 [Mycena olivaceomarginata]
MRRPAPASRKDTAGRFLDGNKSQALSTQDTADKKYEITHLSLSLPLPCRRIPLHRRHRRRTTPCPSSPSSAALILRKLPSPRPAAAAEVCVNIQLPWRAEIRRDVRGTVFPASCSATTDDGASTPARLARRHPTAPQPAEPQPHAQRRAAPNRKRRVDREAPHPFPLPHPVSTPTPAIVIPPRQRVLPPPLPEPTAVVIAGAGTGQATANPVHLLRTVSFFLPPLILIRRLPVSRGRSRSRG